MIVATAGCGGGGGGADAIRATGTLLAVTFPDPNDVNLEVETVPPQQAPLVQQIVFTFSAAPDPARVHANSLPILDDSGLPVPGRYDVAGNVVTFTPRLPTRPLAITANGVLDTGGAGMRIGAACTIRVGEHTFGFIAGVDPALQLRHPDPADRNGVLIRFRTLSVADERAFRGVPARAPRLVAVDPPDGAVGVSPNLWSDPEGRFPPRRAFTLTFDAPLAADAAQLVDTRFELVDLDDRPAYAPSGLRLGASIRLLENDVDRAVVEVMPSGILPLGHLLALQYDRELKGLAELGAAAGGPRVASTFTIAADPGETIADALIERFDDAAREETSIAEVGNGNVPADWDRHDSSVLQAALEFDGTGVLGRFMPVAPATGDTLTIVLETAAQVFPLLDGSTPDAKPGSVVNGGVFHFTDVDLPSGVEIVVRGANPLVFKCTGSVRIAGKIRIDGDAGAPENSFDSAITSIPGGAAVAGGGRGGDAHPISFHPPDQVSYLTLVSPQWAATGFGIDPADGLMKRIGGTGAQCGILEQADGNGRYQTDPELGSCGEFRNGLGNCKLAGGGGGSLLRAGSMPVDAAGARLDGIGNVTPDGTGRFTFDPEQATLASGVGGAHPFALDLSTANDFFGKLGQLRRLIGGQGGGGGGTQTESYFCGNWCVLDGDAANDGVCNNGDRLPAKGRSPAVGDARGGGGGGGGGAFLLQALGSITVASTGSVSARGGSGGGGEGIGCSYWGGSGGGGAGGMVVLQSASEILVESGAVLDVTAGEGARADRKNDYITGCLDMSKRYVGAGGDGGAGLIQLQVPAGRTATVVAPGASDSDGSIRPRASWIDAENTLAPVEFTSRSIALSRWYDVGRAIARSPLGSGPVWNFVGTDATGVVVVDADGDVPAPAAVDFSVGDLGQVDSATHAWLPGEEPRPDYVAPNSRVVVEFQAADAVVPGAKEVDPASLSAWSSTVAIANGRQFLRWRVRFEISVDGRPLTPTTRRPTLEWLRIRFGF